MPRSGSNSCCSPVVALASGVRLPWLRSSVLCLFFPLLCFSHYILYHQSPTPCVCCCCSPFSSHSFQISLNASPHHILGLPRLPFSYTFWPSDLFASFSSLILSMCLANFSLLLINFSLKLSFTQTSTLSSSSLLLSALSTPTILLIQLFSQTCTFFCHT